MATLLILIVNPVENAPEKSAPEKKFRSKSPINHKKTALQRRTVSSRG